MRISTITPVETTTANANPPEVKCRICHGIGKVDECGDETSLVTASTITKARPDDSLAGLVLSFS